MIEKFIRNKPETRSSQFLTLRANLLASKALTGSLANLASPSSVPIEHCSAVETSDQIKAAIFEHIDELNKPTQA